MIVRYLTYTFGGKATLITTGQEGFLHERLLPLPHQPLEPMIMKSKWGHGKAIVNESMNVKFVKGWNLLLMLCE